MRSFGETLRQARLDKGVSLVDAERDTRIRRKYLEALEAEDFAVLPGPVYTRGFVRTYADYLGLDPEAMVDVYQPVPRREQPATHIRPAVPHISLPRDIPVRPVLYALGTIVFVIALAYVWTQYQAAAAAIREQEGIARARAVGTPTLPPRVPTINPIAIASSVVVASPVPSAEPSPEPTAVVDGILVEIKTSARVYVEAAVDGKAVLGEILPAGTQRALPLAQDSVLMRASSGSALDLTVNGKHQDPSDNDGPTEFSWQR